MMRWAVLALVLSGCVAPEEAAVHRPVRPVAEAPVPVNLEPAPTADRKLKEPSSSPIVKVDGLTKAKKTAPPL